MIQIIDYIFRSILIGIISWVWIVIILDTNNFGFIYEFFDKLMGKYKLTRFLFKPLFDCFYCFSGQFSLWYYLWHYGAYDLFNHIGYISIAIITTHIINKKYG